MARRRKWRTSIGQQNPAGAPTTSAHNSISVSNASQPIALPVADLRRVGLIVFGLFALLGGVVALMQSGSNASLVSQYLGRVLHIQS